MGAKKKTTEQTHKKKKDFVPRKKGNRIVWAKNLRKKIQNYGSTLNLTGTEVSELQNQLDDYILAEDALDKAKVTQKAATKAAAGALKILDKSARKKARRMKSSSGYDTAIGKDLQIDGEEHIAHLEEYKPKVRKIFLEAGEVHIDVVKGDAEAFSIYARPRGGKGWVLIGAKIKYSPFIDVRPLANPLIPEAREYKARGIFGDREIGQDSNIVSIIYGG